MKRIWLHIKNGLKNSNWMLFWFCAIWTVAHIAILWVEFFLPEFKVSSTMKSVYLPFLGVYTLAKEVKNWTGDNAHQKPGEIFPFIWGGTALIMFLLGFFSKGQYSIPTEMGDICGWVLAIFGGNLASKTFREKKEEKEEKEKEKKEEE